MARARELGVIPDGARPEAFEPTAEPWSELSDEQRRRQARAQEIYAGMVEYLDMSVGRLIDYLEESGQFDNTIVIFSSDHGGSYSDVGLVESIPPARISPRDNRYENLGRPGSYIDHGLGFGALIRGDYKLLSEPREDEADVISWELYNIREDPGETRDLAAQHPDLVAELVQEWETDWRGPLIRRRL